MLATLLELEHEFVGRYYPDMPEFDNVVKVRAFTALQQVLFESNAHKRPLYERTEALQLFFNTGNVDSIIAATRYSEIKSYFSGSFRLLDFWLVRGHMFTGLCMWIDLNLTLLNMRVWMVSKMKKVLCISQEHSLSSLFKKK